MKGASAGRRPRASSAERRARSGLLFSWEMCARTRYRAEESNHDLDMLKVGPYPWVVKQRVLSRTGHLSNHAVSEFLADPEGFDGRARYLVLAHISQENNNPDLALLCAEEALGRRPAEFAFTGELLVASQDVPLKPLEL